MIPADEAAIPSETARLIEVALWNRGGSVKNQGDTIPPMLVATKAMATAVARR
jgi:hypothetical protein